MVEAFEQLLSLGAGRQDGDEATANRVQHAGGVLQVRPPAALAEGRVHHNAIEVAGRLELQEVRLDHVVPLGLED